jgi:hypothetical protein
MSDGPRASSKRADISPPWLYPMPPRRTPPQKMSHGYSRAKLTNASSSPTRQSQITFQGKTWKLTIAISQQINITDMCTAWVSEIHETTLTLGIFGIFLHI